jgi:hypothetical protein
MGTVLVLLDHRTRDGVYYQFGQTHDVRNLFISDGPKSSARRRR